MKNNKVFNYIIVCLATVLGIWIRYCYRDFLSGDMGSCLLPWYDELKAMDMKTALGTQVGNYNVLYQFLIKCISYLPIQPIYAYKILSVIFDFILAGAAAGLVYKISDKKNAAIFTYFCVYLSPLVILNSAAWGQCDSMYTAFILLALLFMYCDHSIISCCLMGVAFAFKLQAIFVVPFYGFCYLKRKNFKLWHALFTPITFFAIGSLNILFGRKISDLLAIYVGQTSEYPQMYLNYPSFWVLFKDDYAHLHIPAIVITLVILFVFLFYVLKKKIEPTGKNYIWVAFLFTYACVLFLPAMHERYGYIYEVLAILLTILERKHLIALLSLLAIDLRIYQAYLYGLTYNAKIFACINIGLFLYYLVIFVCKEMPKKEKVSNKQNGTFLSWLHRDTSEAAEGFLVEKQDWIRIGIVTLAFFVLGLIGLGSHKAPKTEVCYGTESENGSDVVLDFEGYVHISKLMLFLGNESYHNLSVSVAKDGAWEVIDGQHILYSPFTWNEIMMERDVYEIGLVFPDTQTKILELVCLDGEGNPILPINADRYPELFDEQELYPKHVTYYEGTMFDEVYHGRTAYEMLHNLTIYETTHPPLGKILISIGIAIFGMNPFGWRIICLLFGCAMIPIMYLFAYRLTNNRTHAGLSICLLATEFMHFTLSRISTIDVIVAFFVLCMFYFMYSFTKTEKVKYLYFAGITSALGVATKWTACYAMVGLALIFFIWVFKKYRQGEIRKDTSKYWIKLFLYCVVCFIVLPLTVYVLSYIPFAKVYPDKGLITHAIENSKYMLGYHKNVFDSHPFASKWYQWLIDCMPLIDSRVDLGDGRFSVVATLFNPLVCILGLLALMHEIYLVIRKKDENALTLVLAYIVMLLPWVFIKRTVFIYQYFICSQILILMICHSLHSLRIRKGNRAVFGVGVASVVLFAMFYPVISGISVDYDYVKQWLQWLPTWYFV